MSTKSNPKDAKASNAVNPSKKLNPTKHPVKEAKPRATTKNSILPRDKTAEKNTQQGLDPVTKDTHSNSAPTESPKDETLKRKRESNLHPSDKHNANDPTLSTSGQPVKNAEPPKGKRAKLSGENEGKLLKKRQRLTKTAPIQNAVVFVSKNSAKNEMFSMKVDLPILVEDFKDKVSDKLAEMERSYVKKPAYLVYIYRVQNSKVYKLEPRDKITSNKATFIHSTSPLASVKAAAKTARKREKKTLPHSKASAATDPPAQKHDEALQAVRKLNETLMDLDTNENDTPDPDQDVADDLDDEEETVEPETILHSNTDESDDDSFSDETVSVNKKRRPNTRVTDIPSEKVDDSSPVSKM